MEFFHTYGVGLVAGGILVLVLLALLNYSGLFLNVVVRRVENGVSVLRVAYLYNQGPFNECGPLFDRVNKIAPHNRCIGVYYDDPETTPSSELRYIVGSILTEGNEPMDEELVNNFKKSGFQLAEFPDINDALTVEFPFPWMVSIFFAIWKVYPKLTKYMKNHSIVAGPAVEIYCGPKINFYMPIGNYESYLVQEALSDGKLKSS